VIDPWVEGGGLVECSSEPLEYGLDDVMGVRSGQQPHMQGHPGVVHERLEELESQIGVETTDVAMREIYVVGEVRSTAYVDTHEGEGFVHGQLHAAVAHDTPPVPQGLGECGTEAYAHVLHGVVPSGLQIAGGPHLEIEAAVRGRQFEHVIEEAHPRIHRARAVPIEVESHGNIGLARAPLDMRRATPCRWWCHDQASSPLPGSAGQGRRACRGRIAHRRALPDPARPHPQLRRDTMELEAFAAGDLGQMRGQLVRHVRRHLHHRRPTDEGVHREGR